MPNFIMAALSREPITIYGNGLQTRSFCYVSDMVAGLMAVMLEPKTRGEVFNLGNPHEITMLDLAAFVAEQLGSEAGMVFRPLPPMIQPSGSPISPRRSDTSAGLRASTWNRAWPRLLSGFGGSLPFHHLRYRGSPGSRVTSDAMDERMPLPSGCLAGFAPILREMMVTHARRCSVCRQRWERATRLAVDRTRCMPDDMEGIDPRALHTTRWCRLLVPSGSRHLLAGYAASPVTRTN
jgi:hypothetical protein